MRVLSLQNFLSLALLVAGTSASPNPSLSDSKVKETILPPRGWLEHSPAPRDHIINLRIALPQPGFPELERNLYEVSDPDHARYGAHLSKEEVDRLVAPAPESVDLVNEWLFSHGIDSEDIGRSSAGDWVTIAVPVSIAEKMLDTSYSVWKHEDTDEYLIRTTSYSLPSHLFGHVEVVQPTTSFARLTGMKSHIVRISDLPIPSLDVTKPITDAATGSVVNATCQTSITVDCLRQLYNVGKYKPSEDTETSIGITGYLEEYANYDDLDAFYRDQVPEAEGSGFEYINVNGGLNNQTKPGPEADLDVQFAFGLSHPVPGTFWSTGGRPPFKPDMHTPTNTNEPYADWVEFVLKQDEVPHVISTSYGEQEQTIPEDYARRVCAEFAKISARGVSLIVSSGDYGVGDGKSTSPHQCYTNDGRNITRFMPNFPASCPHVTAVGGTTGIPEVATKGFFSGGGFSDYFPRPEWQEKLVDKYLGLLGNDTYKDLFNRGGRAFPDVAAQGEYYRIWYKGKPVSIGGTSASAPAFAGIIALLNDARISDGKRPLGFLNPWLYSSGYRGLNKVQSGHNSGCGTIGFNVTVNNVNPEWNPVTGLGTPNFEKLMHLMP